MVQFQKAIALGEGTYDLLHYYANSLANLGKTDQAIDWYYKTLDVVPYLVDARGNLATLLVQKKRYFEALALLASFDEHLAAIGQQPYFTGQRIAIESDMRQADPKQFEEKAQLRLSKTYGNFYAPVILGQSRVTAFMVDTGAAVSAVSDAFLKNALPVLRLPNPPTRSATSTSTSACWGCVWSRSRSTRTTPPSTTSSTATSTPTRGPT